ncbi:hypothetical protein ACHAW5_009654 [Stephanodiscus triporus]|uniref:Uncharacterized protein n=1 Tax=Stephanodiscus triporus TaxID=2934178 RepID=A0ABD3P120_9STRA
MTSNAHGIPSDIGIHLQVQVPAHSSVGNFFSVEPTSGGGFVRAVLKYNNEDGRNAILAAAKTVHHDFGPFNNSLAVSLTLDNLKDIKTNPNVDWFEGDGKVIYCSIR